MRRIATIVACGFVLGAGPLGAQERILLGGAGGMVPVMQELARGYEAKNPSERIEFLPTSLGSTGGIKATEAGRVAIGLTSRPLKAEEKGRLVHRVFGRMPVILAVHRDVPVGSLTESQVCDVFGGKIRSWREVGGAEVRIVALTRNEDDSDKLALRTMGCFRHLAESPDVIVITKSKEMAEALGNRPGTIGLIDLAAVLSAQGRFKPVAINSVVPAADSMRSGSYKLVKEFGVVTLGEPQGLAKRFLEFLVGPEGERILAKDGVTVVR